MRLDEAARDEYTDRFVWSAGRQEVNDGYAVASDDDGFQRYLANLPKRSDLGAGWHQ